MFYDDEYPPPRVKHIPIAPPRPGTPGEGIFLRLWQDWATANPREWVGIFSDCVDRPRQRAASVAASFMVFIGCNGGRSFTLEAGRLVICGAFMTTRSAYIAAWAHFNERQRGVNSGLRMAEFMLAAEHPTEGLMPLERRPRRPEVKRPRALRPGAKDRRKPVRETPTERSVGQVGESGGRRVASDLGQVNDLPPISCWSGVGQQPARPALGEHALDPLAPKQCSHGAPVHARHLSLEAADLYLLRVAPDNHARADVGVHRAGARRVDAQLADNVFVAHQVGHGPTSGGAGGGRPAAQAWA